MDLQPADVGALLLKLRFSVRFFFLKFVCYLEAVKLPDCLSCYFLVWLVGWLLGWLVGWVICWIPCIPGHRANRRATEWPAMAKVGEN